MEKYFLPADSRWEAVCDSLEDIETHASELRDILTDALDDLGDEACMLHKQLVQLAYSSEGRVPQKRDRQKSTVPAMQGSRTKTAFTCDYLPEKGMEPWDGTVDPLLPFDPTDFEVCARGSMFHMVMGHYSSGQYLCIPNWGIGVDIVDPDDCFWNYEHLRNAYPNLKKVDAISIVNAMVAIKHYDEISNPCF